MMRFNSKPSFSPETPKSYWNCYSPFNTEKQLFLANKPNNHSQTNKEGTFRHQRKESEITYIGPPKVSLKNKRESKLNHTVRVIKEDSSISLFGQNPRALIPTIRAPQLNHSQSSLIVGGRSPTSHISSIAQLQPMPPQIVVTPAFIKIAALNSSPVPQHCNIHAHTDPKSQEVSQTQNKNVITKQLFSNIQIIDALQSQSFKQKQKEQQDRLKKYRAQLKLPQITYKTKDFLSNQRTKETSHNPQPELLSPYQHKQSTSKSLMTQNKVCPTKEQQDIWSMTEPVRSFCSEKNIRKPRIQRMSQVQEIKSQPDSDQNSNLSENQSIVVGRLQELQSFFNSKQLQGSSIPFSKINASNSSIHLRDTQ